MKRRRPWTFRGSCGTTKKIPTGTHIADHDLSIEDIEQVLGHPSSQGVSRSAGLPAAWGYTLDARYIIVVYEEVDEETIRVITAYEVPEPRNH